MTAGVSRCFHVSAAARCSSGDGAGSAPGCRAAYQRLPLSETVSVQIGAWLMSHWANLPSKAVASQSKLPTSIR